MGSPIWRNKVTTEHDYDMLQEYVRKYGINYIIKTWNTKKEYSGVMHDYNCKKFKGSLSVITATWKDLVDEAKSYDYPFVEVVLNTSDVIKVVPLMKVINGEDVSYGVQALKQAKYLARDGFTN